MHTRSHGHLPLIGLLGSTSLSVTGNAMVGVLIPWLALNQTGNAAYAGLIASVALVAAVISLSFGAALLDRWDKRNLSVGADLLSALSVAAIPVVDRFAELTIPIIAILVVVGAVFDGPGRSAREALRPDIAARSGVSLERTNALGEVTDGIGNIAGPAGAGVAVAAVGHSTSLWVAAALLAAAGVVFWALEPPKQRDHLEAHAESYLAATIGGFRLVWNDPVLRSTAIAASVFGLFLAPLVLVFTAAFEADGRSAALGGLLAAFSIGSVGGAIAYAIGGDRLPRRPTLVASLIGATAGLAAIAAFLDSYAALIAAAIGTGVVAGPAGPIFSVIIQQRTTDAYRGRVLATIGTLEMIAAPISLAITGIIIERTSPTTALVAVASGAAIATIYTTSTPGLRYIEPDDLDRSRPQPGRA